MLEAWVLNKEDMQRTIMLDTYESFIWTERYNEAGEFEFHAPMRGPFNITDLKAGNYLQIDESEKLMIVEDISVDTDPEAGDHMTITGRTLESILERRIVWDTTTISGNFQDGIKRLITEAIIEPSDINRQIPNFKMVESKNPVITAKTLDIQVDRGENLYDVIVDLCKDQNVGFRITPDYDNVGFLFELYAGTDRSFDQEAENVVVFSNEYENLLATNYYESDRDYKNSVYVYSETEQTVTSDDGSSESQTIVRKTEYKLADAKGLDRRETFLESDIEEGEEMELPESEDINGDGEISYYERSEYRRLQAEAQARHLALEQDYIKQLEQAGKDELKNWEKYKTFDGEIEWRVQFVFNKDFFLGDVVQVANSYGNEAKCRITEIVMTHDSTSETIVPTFVNTEEEDGTGGLS